MSTSLALLALSGLLASSPEAEKPNWLTDYAAARRIGRELQKPLVVVMGSGQEGWEKVSQDGKLGKNANQLLAENYVCVYVDTTKAYGQQLAQAFELTRGPGLVISDRGGNLQLFSHQGTMSTEALTSRLQHHAGIGSAVGQADATRVERLSYYPPGSVLSTAPSYSPAFGPSYSTSVHAVGAAPTYATPSYVPTFSGGRNC